ncbi:nucleotidyltransferase [Fibrobacteres bacterium R8-0-B4]
MMCDKAVLDEATSRVCAAAKEVLGGKLRKVLLYGSYARGDYDEYSDIDIFILADIPQEECCDAGLDIREFIWEYELEQNIIISPHVTGYETFLSWLDVLPFYMNVEKEGIVLYAA